MTIAESCQDCDWESQWDGGSASEDPGVSHAKTTGHTVQSWVLPDGQKIPDNHFPCPIGSCDYHHSDPGRTYAHILVEHKVVDGAGLHMSDVLQAIDNVAAKMEDEDFTGATREMVLDGAAQRIKSEVKRLAE